MFIKFQNHTIINSNNISKIEKKYKLRKTDWIKYITISLVEGSETDIFYETEEQRNAEFDKVVALLEAK